jgi:hypothetical protein
MCPLLRRSRRKISSLIRKWFVYLSVMGVMGISNRLWEHISVLKPWRLVKQVSGYLMMH